MLVLICHACKKTPDLKYEDFNEEDFELVPGVVTKIQRERIWASRGGSIFQYNAEYAFNLDSDTIKVGRQEDIEMVINEGEGAYILVHKNNPKVSFFAGLRLTPNHEKIVKQYLKKSRDSGVRFFGIN